MKIIDTVDKHGKIPFVKPVSSRCDWGGFRSYNEHGDGVRIEISPRVDKKEIEYTFITKKAEDTTNSTSFPFPTSFPNACWIVVPSEVFSNRLNNVYKAWAVNRTSFAYYTNSPVKNDAYIIAIGH